MLRRSRVRGFRLAGLALALALVPGVAAAQNNVSIEGQVRVGRGGTPNTRLEIALVTAIGVEVSRGYTDQEGKFRFPHVNAGEYKIVVKAPYKGPYKDGSADVHVEERPGSQVVSVTVVLDEAETSPAPKAGTVAVEETQASIPRQARKLYENGTKAAGKGRTEEAVAYFRSALQIAPDYLFALNDLGAQLLKLDKLDESVEVLRRATSVAPRSFSPRMNLGVALLSSGKPAEARTEIAIALEARPDDPNALYVSGQIEWTLGNRERAIQAFDRALLNSNGRLVAALIHLGRLYEETGNRGAAVQAYETYLDAAGDGQFAAFARSRLEALGASSPK
jgi:hypothetical protein